MEICAGCSLKFNTKIGLGLHKNKCKFIDTVKINEDLFEYKCYCNKKFDKKSKLRAHSANCKTHKEFILNERAILTRDLLYDLYFIKKMSAFEIANSFTLKHTRAGDIIKLLKEYGFETRTIKQAANSQNTREKYVNTCLKKYGTTNALSKNTKPYIKKNSTVIDKYGVSNVFKDHSVKDKIKKTLIDRYGVDNPQHIPGKIKNHGRKSKIHIKVEKLLTDIGISFISENNNNLFKKNGYSPRPDILIEDLNLVIEIYGNYWHGNPLYYKENDIISRWKGKLTVKEIWKIDEFRINQIKSFNWKVLILWESDIINLTKEKLWKKLNQLKS
jgi:G:T-mismatch repair DNA endonuclease (very short patch repair protein)